MASAGPGIGLLVFGAILAVIGWFGYVTCVSQPISSEPPPSCGPSAVFVGLGVILLLVGIVMVIAALVGRTGMVQQVPDPSIPPPVFQPVVVPQVAVGRRLQLRCAYCGSLFDAPARSCPSCGAPVAGP